MKYIVTIICALFIFTGFSAAAAPKVTVDITMNDGKEYKAAALQKIPQGHSKEIKIVADGMKVTLPSADIDHMVLWHNDNPDLKAVLKYQYFGSYDPKTNVYEQYKKMKAWFVLDTPGPNINLWVYSTKIKPTARGISMEVGNAPYYFEKPGADFLVNVPHNVWKPSQEREWLKAYLADDQVLCDEMSENSELNRNFFRQQAFGDPDTFREIARIYTPGRMQ